MLLCISIVQEFVMDSWHGMTWTQVGRAGGAAACAGNVRGALPSRR
jgi:hypothetical protein